MQSLFAYTFCVNYLKYKHSSGLDTTILSIQQMEEVEIKRRERIWGVKSKGNVVIKKKLSRAD